MHAQAEIPSLVVLSEQAVQLVALVTQAEHYFSQVPHAAIPESKNPVLQSQVLPVPKVLFASEQSLVHSVALLHPEEPHT